MSDRPWTPGPWRACNEGECKCGQVWSSPADCPVATVTWEKWGESFPAIRIPDAGAIGAVAEPYMEFMEYGGIPIEDCKANARLIAAAPDMYEALERMVELFDGYQGLALENAKEALMKARGEDA